MRIQNFKWNSCLLSTKTQENDDVNFNIFLIRFSSGLSVTKQRITSSIFNEIELTDSSRNTVRKINRKKSIIVSQISSQCRTLFSNFKSWIGLIFSANSCTNVKSITETRFEIRYMNKTYFQKSDLWNRFLNYLLLARFHFYNFNKAQSESSVRTQNKTFKPNYKIQWNSYTYTNR